MKGIAPPACDGGQSKNNWKLTFQEVKPNVFFGKDNPGLKICYENIAI